MFHAESLVNIAENKLLKCSRAAVMLMEDEMPIINVPEVFRKKLNEDGTYAFVGILNQVE